MDVENKDVLLTREGYDKIEMELEHLKIVKRAEVAEKIKVARSFGDISENAEYDEAKNEQAQLEERISKLENTLRVATVVEEGDAEKNVVTVGSKVRIKYRDPIYQEEDIEEYTIVGSAEADPTESKISNASPVGRSLLGRRIDDVVDVQVPDGVAKITILEIWKLIKEEWIRVQDLQ